MNDAYKKSVFNIPSGVPFARSIIRTLLQDYANTPEDLAAYTILLPTRRACRTFQEIFLQETGGTPLLLPTIQPMGDVDEQDLSLSLAGTEALEKILSLPPAISPLRRRILLAKTIQAIEGFTNGFDQALALGDALASFLDQIIIEDLSFSDLADIVPEEFSRHWQITLDFLKILSEAWPKILAEEGVIDAADRRNRLMHILAAHWQETRPQTPIIAAGSTGSIPATARLLGVIAALPRGTVILPGLDNHIDEDSWNTLLPSHPQYGFKVLLRNIGLDKKDVKHWPGICEESTMRTKLASEMMRPAETAREWTHQYDTAQKKEELDCALEGLSLIETSNQREEAAMIALKFREVLETKNSTAALITPDRKLARRVSGFCKRWGIEIDDSAGQKLNATPLGTYLLLLCEVAISNLSPAALLSLLKHKYSRAGMGTDEYHRNIYALDQYLLRGLKPQPGFDGLYQRFTDRTTDKHSDDPPDHLMDFMRIIEPILQPFLNLMTSEKPRKISVFIKNHLELAEILACTDSAPGEHRLWRDEDGEAAAAFFAELSEQASSFDDMDGPSYLRILSHLMGDITVRPKYGTHPRLSILGQLESRLIDADMLILGGLNEGSWPPDPGHDPWMSRPMRAQFGLPDPDRNIGLTAHDFVQGFCAPQVLLTRSKTIDAAASVPARWLQRLDTVLRGAGKTLDILHNNSLVVWHEALDDHVETEPVKRPRPVPPLDKRPKSLSVTQIETLMKDPYAIYAKKILGLSKLEDLEKPIEAKEKGTLLHYVLERFITEHKDNIPANAKDILKSHADDHIKQLHDDASLWSFWWPRFERLCDWFIANEIDWRFEKRARPLQLEAKGEWTIKTDSASLKLKGIADRIDLMPDGSCAIIDYKTGSGFSSSKMASGDTPQLPLEAIMLNEGGFAKAGIATGKITSYLAYWSLTGGSQAGKITPLPSSREKDLQTIIDNTRAGLERLIESFADPDMPYICLPRAHAMPRFNDFEHLERIKEWAALEDEDSASEAA